MAQPRSAATVAIALARAAGERVHIMEESLAGCDEGEDGGAFNNAAGRTKAAIKSTTSSSVVPDLGQALARVEANAELVEGKGPFGALQVADYGDEFHLLAKADLVHTHLF